MRNAALLGLGVVLLLLQGNLFRVLDDLPLGAAAGIWSGALALDVFRMFGGRSGHPRAIATVRADLLLPATVLLAAVLLRTVGHVHVGRPVPAFVLPLILFLGVHEYSLARGAAMAFVLGYFTDIVGIAPVGLYTFTYVATFVLARGAGVRLAAQTTGMQAVLVGAFSLLQSTMVLVLLAIFGRDAWVPRTLYPLAVPHAVVTAAFAPLVFRIAQAVDDAAGGATRPPVGAGVA